MLNFRILLSSLSARFGVNYPKSTPMWHPVKSDDPQVKIFYLGMRFVVTGCLALTVKDIVFYIDYYSIVIQLGIVALVYYFDLLYKKGHSIDKLSTYLGVLLLSSLTLGAIVSGGGLNAGNLAIFIIIIFCSTALIPPKKQIPMAVFALANIIAVAIAELIDPSIRYAGTGTRFDLIRSDVMIIILTTIGYFFSRQIIVSYLNEREKNRRNYEKIKQQAQELESVSAFKTKLFAILSHDLISPLQGINNVVGLVQHNLAEQGDGAELASRKPYQVIEGLQWQGFGHGPDRATGTRSMIRPNDRGIERPAL